MNFAAIGYSLKAPAPDGDFYLVKKNISNDELMIDLELHKDDFFPFFIQHPDKVYKDPPSADISWAMKQLKSRGILFK